MRSLAIAFIILTASWPTCAQTFSVTIPFHLLGHPVASWKQSSGSQKFMFISWAMLQSANVGDAYTTYRGVVVGNGCETNPAFQTADCPTPHNLAAGKFGFAKGAIAFGALAEYLPTWGISRPKGYYLFFGIINTAAAVPLGIVDIHNVIQLRN